MCGIVGAIAERNVVPILLEGLTRLAYRGYDSAGIALVNSQGALERVRVLGKVDNLKTQLQQDPKQGLMGIAHTRWATHGAPSEANAHPHVGGDRVVMVHNGIIENYAELKQQLVASGYVFSSDTDSEVVAVCIERALEKGATSLREAVRTVLKTLRGAYAICVMDRQAPNMLVAARLGSPLVIGLGIGEHFVASDSLALQPVSNRFVYLEEGDIAEIRKDGFVLFDDANKPVVRKEHLLTGHTDPGDKEPYRHFMQKEIYEQPRALAATLEGCLNESLEVPVEVWGTRAKDIFPQVKKLQIVACGTSYHAGLVAKYWFEAYCDLPCDVEIASEFRYRKKFVQPGTLLICISQSGETADSLAAIKEAKTNPHYIGSLGICNVADSALTRLCDLNFLTAAGPEIGVCSTKAFTTQLLSLLILCMTLVDKKALTKEARATWCQALTTLPTVLEAFLAQDAAIEVMAKQFVNKKSALFLGRGPCFPIALEGALKLKEISYIHAEAYPAGELKHGPLALVDADMPVVVIGARDGVWEKLKSNIQEVRARGGEIFAFVDETLDLRPEPGIHVLPLPKVLPLLAPIAYSIPLQLLAYHVAVFKGTDVDQPRNLAKSVTVE